jgi:hypothetical protein
MVNLFAEATTLQENYSVYRELLFKHGWKSIYDDTDSERFVKNGIILIIKFEIGFDK